jgi:hypothetical protein
VRLGQDPTVLAFPSEKRRDLVGEEPTRCRHGHAYAQPGSTYPVVDKGWTACCTTSATSSLPFWVS